MAKAKSEGAVSLQEAAEAFIALHDSGNYNNRRYHRVLGLLRDAVHESSDSNFGPIMPDPDDMRPELDDEQQAAADDLIFVNNRVDDLIHPGGRLQKAKESVDEILKNAEEGTLANDGGRTLAAKAKEAAAEAEKSDSEKKPAAVTTDK